MFPTLIQIGSFRIATYGVIVAAGYLLGIAWLTKERERMGLDEERFWSLIYALFIGAILGGKLMYWGVEWRSLLDGSLHPLRDIRYGFVFFGGLLGSCVTGAWWVRRHKAAYLKLADYFGVALPMGHSIGRLGCLMAGCCAGRPTQVPWAIRFTHPESLVAPHLRGVGLHPTQLYESLAVGAVAYAALRTIRRVQAGTLPAGSAFALYIGLYSFARFVIEFFRGDDRGGFFFGLSPAQCISLAVSVWALWIYTRRRFPKEVA
ncbi:MAG: prolipoprotein diacylglyceryl transferase [Elusimicrobia bacterium CG1_02_63_36]|nr:MAG: prolipoprotein diacylglyceryl transferase [Elusimicrobia bacterium CG1_02_63_36]PIP83969.1 MAG: prolipoprotein diacylglyceryl transferase [Elusimicrobia bacterium CG22_combo_CG10-13_8_21_14_all_63_91]PJA17266.1 MAG: prolipoprotein diacylglyceryl transferase [Elusimicrobia bacterium CG_4_10_14_0_2_um_filter_63_34]PJB23853.1 MAG: prolipoprotein diacylglyceryl transferase [Elusimicrobia bacterium CG_4_9_14_3_um_filter_62_55]